MARIVSTAATSALAVIALASAPATAHAQSFDQLEGWWSYQMFDDYPHQGCSDEDGQARLAIGRYARAKTGEILFGEGKRAIGFYDGSCSVGENLIAAEREFGFSTTCSIEGEEYTGIAAIKMLGAGTVKLSLPMQDDVILSACTVDHSKSGSVKPGSQMNYGSRLGMTVTVLGATATDTEAAMLYVEHTPADALGFCALYSGRTDDACIRAELGIELATKLRANCVTGDFENFYGEKFTFEGRYSEPEKQGAEFRIYNHQYQSMSDDSLISGYAVALEIFSTLCPSRLQPQDSIGAPLDLTLNPSPQPPKASFRPDAAPQAASATIIEQLARLAALRASGAIDEAEFSSMKADLLARAAS